MQIFGLVADLGQRARRRDMEIHVAEVSVLGEVTADRHRAIAGAISKSMLLIASRMCRAGVGDCAVGGTLSGGGTAPASARPPRQHVDARSEHHHHAHAFLKTRCIGSQQEDRAGTPYNDAHSWPDVTVCVRRYRRPVFLLAADTPGFQKGVGVMVMFTGGVHVLAVRAGAEAGCRFHHRIACSRQRNLRRRRGHILLAMSNIDFEIGTAIRPRGDPLYCPARLLSTWISISATVWRR